MFKNYSIPFSFIAGIISFFSPCILPLIPIYLSYITGYSIEEFKTEKELSYSKIILPSLCFIIGFTIIFVLLGASSTFLGSLILKKKNILKYMRFIGGALIILFGLHILGIFKIKKFNQEKKLRPKKINSGCAGAFILGIALASGWTPCVGPILTSILIIASMEETVKRGIILLFFYSLGLGVPFIVISLLTKKIFLFLNKTHKYFNFVKICTALLLILLGVLLVLNRFNFTL
ncbi:MAG TPA: cytochrome c biogenesis protein CcdA [bacterium]|nr:cytochrome c biogenesis protein CcdA [bacterium]HOM27338.1 cytochrome c biogenesis protein CcdA [bacterium]